jgi:hypothetical protein
VLKKSITYKDFNDVEQTETFAFHLSPPKLMELEAKWPGGLEKHMERIMESGDGAQILELFQTLIQMSIGQVSEDGKRFVQNDEIRDGFIQTNAYTVLFLELGANEQTAADFFNGIVPKDLADQLEKVNTENPPQVERAVAESTPIDAALPKRKVLSVAEARRMGRDELFAKVKEGYEIQT